MKPGETTYIGDGAYLHYDGHGFEFRANHHETPTDRVYIDRPDVLKVVDLMRVTLTRESHEALEGK